MSLDPKTRKDGVEGVYSHSRLSSYENCPLQYRYRYVDKLPSERESIEAFMGKRVHEILERLYHHVGRYGRPPSLAQVHERFRKDWPLHMHEEVHVVRTEFDTGHYHDLGLRCLENYYRSHYPFDKDETVAIEQKVSVALDPAKQYRMRGIIDRLVRRRDGVYEVHDYKTSGSLPPKRRIESDRQLALYQIAIEAQYPDARDTELVWHYLLFDRTLRSKRSPEQLDELKQTTIERIDEMTTASEFPAKTGPLCRWCEYGEICPANPNKNAEAPTEGPLAPAPPPVDGDLLPAQPLMGHEAPPTLRAPVQLSLLPD